jgi:hypothetical protein
MPSNKNDPFAVYEIGIQRLLTHLGQAHPRYAEALIYQQRLSENLAKARQYGDTPELQHNRAVIIAAANMLACEIGVPVIALDRATAASRMLPQSAVRPPRLYNHMLILLILVGVVGGLMVMTISGGDVMNLVNRAQKSTAVIAVTTASARTSETMVTSVQQLATTQARETAVAETATSQAQATATTEAEEVATRSIESTSTAAIAATAQSVQATTDARNVQETVQSLQLMATTNAAAQQASLTQTAIAAAAQATAQAMDNAQMTTTALAALTQYDGYWEGSSTLGPGIAFRVSKGQVYDLGTVATTTTADSACQEGILFDSTHSEEFTGNTFFWETRITTPPSPDYNPYFIVQIEGTFISSNQASGRIVYTIDIPGVNCTRVEGTWEATKR